VERPLRASVLKRVRSAQETESRNGSKDVLSEHACSWSSHRPLSICPRASRTIYARSAPPRPHRESADRLSADFEPVHHAGRGLNLLVVLITAWNTVYLTQEVDALRSEGHGLPDELLQHVSPSKWEHI
jgi:Tn3 transposase DDE domain